ncbi:vWA domain-containing protein [Flavivirga spongiicola]|uniref:VWA domain-containing protein n=1 Tax=Flavivirga spongiicola TaxID=421621 RepID=A0ABU7XVD1_9FLAO|nr:VWA domain-containing protein [Flavivirga sp. MEBiC05379]MDO5979543.1 VWA domain-containing protein [Flavivirga sp. MEBiC05379]
MKLLITLFCALGLSIQTYAQQDAPSPILFIYDASGSMWGQLDGKTKKEIASEVLATSVSNLPENQNIGLVTYGHRTKGDCDDVEFMVDITNNSKEKVKNAVIGINPLGRTPLARSATMAINSLKERNTKATIILITDGIESCDGNICDVVTKAKTDGIDFKLHIVGFGLKESETEQLKCAANAGDGKYYDASDASGLGDVLAEATTETVDDPSDNFSIYAVKNGKPVDAWIKVVKAGTNDEIDGARTYRDTGWVYLPPGKYDMIIKPLESTKIKGTTVSIESIKDKIGHQTVSFDGGKINLTTLNNNEGWDCTSKVKTQKGEVVGGSRTYGKPKIIELNPGVYDIEVMALKIKGLKNKFIIEDVTVEATKTVDVSHNFQSGIAMIGVKSGDVLVDAVVSIKTKETGENVAGSRTYTSDSSNPREFMLNPGVYEVKVSAVKKEYAGKKETFTIEVKKGETVTKIISF